MFVSVTLDLMNTASHGLLFDRQEEFLINPMNCHSSDNFIFLKAMTEDAANPNLVIHLDWLLPGCFYTHLVGN